MESTQELVKDKVYSSLALFNHSLIIEHHSQKISSSSPQQKTRGHATTKHTSNPKYPQINFIKINHNPTLRSS